MSIYHGFRRPLSDLHANAMLGRDAPSDGPLSGWLARPPVHLRRANPCSTLFPPTLKWLRSMPHDVCPVALATKYARVANNLFAAWGKPAECRHYFNELTSDRRGGREGFPQDVIRDLEVLRAWHDELHPSTENQRTWEQLQAVGIDRT